MISNLGELAGREHYLAFLLILIVSCVLLSRNIMSERVDQGEIPDYAAGLRAADPPGYDGKVCTDGSRSS